MSQVVLTGGLTGESRLYIGIDTSNYTTSAAVFDASTGTFLSNVKRLLGVAEGERGLRQSDAVFAHVRNLPSVTAEAFESLEPANLCAIGVSATPRDVEGSYMPCFLAGLAAASTLSAAVKKPLHTFSHQAGHVMAAVWSSGAVGLLESDFLAFHVSGGTTELLRVKRGEDRPFDIEKLGGTLDLNAGQAIDRSGVKLGLGFPCGPKLEELALSNNEPIERSGVSVKGMECNLSGLENKVDRLIADVLYAGGVMSNSIIKKMLANKMNGRTKVHFAEPKFSSDNAAGTALLCAVEEEGVGCLKKR